MRTVIMLGAALLVFGTGAYAADSNTSTMSSASDAEILFADRDRRDNRKDDRGDDRDGRQDCREEEGAGKDKRDCKQGERKDDRTGGDDDEQNG